MLQEGSMVKKPPFQLVQGTLAVLPEPPTSLGEAGRALWRSIQAQYGIADAGGLAILEQACGATDRVAEYAAIINEQGAVIITKAGMRGAPTEAAYHDSSEMSLCHSGSDQALAVLVRTFPNAPVVSANLATLSPLADSTIRSRSRSPEVR